MAKSGKIEKYFTLDFFGNVLRHTPWPSTVHTVWAQLALAQFV